jgi:hypothetical protein
MQRRKSNTRSQKETAKPIPQDANKELGKERRNLVKCKELWKKGRRPMECC